MKIVLDVNILVDVAVRPSMFPDSAELLKELFATRCTVAFPTCAYTTLHYLLRELTSAKSSLAFFDLLERRGIEFIPFSSAEITLARKLKLPDLEDACVLASALSAHADGIVSRDPAGFKGSPLPIYTPSRLLARLRS